MIERFFILLVFVVILPIQVQGGEVVKAKPKAVELIRLPVKLLTSDSVYIKSHKKIQAAFFLKKNGQVIEWDQKLINALRKEHLFVVFENKGEVYSFPVSWVGGCCYMSVTATREDLTFIMRYNLLDVYEVLNKVQVVDQKKIDALLEEMGKR